MKLQLATGSFGSNRVSRCDLTWSLLPYFESANVYLLGHFFFLGNVLRNAISSPVANPAGSETRVGSPQMGFMSRWMVIC